MKLLVFVLLFAACAAIRPRPGMSMSNGNHVSEMKLAGQNGHFPEMQRKIVTNSSMIRKRSSNAVALNGQKDICTGVNGPNVLEIVFPANARWAYAGVTPNPNYLCVGQLESNPEDEVLMYSFAYANTKTSCFFDHITQGCWFAFAWDCLDPVLRQDIFDSQICTFQGTPQEVADRLSAAIRVGSDRPDYMVVVVHLDSFEAWSSPFDDNMCSVFTESTDYQIIISKVAVR